MKNERKAKKRKKSQKEKRESTEGQPRLGGFPEDRLFDTPALTLQCIQTGADSGFRQWFVWPVSFDLEDPGLWAEYLTL